MTDLPQEDVQSYPRPPALEPVPQRIEITLGGKVIVSTTDAYRVLETHHAPTYYIPRDAIDAQMIPAGGGSHCEWKGAARYFDIGIGATVARRAAWTYPKPTPRFEAITDHLAFYASLMERCTVAGIPAVPQPGDFYGGWVTPNLSGIVKGKPGTLHW
ncbi:MAG: DUF427 domain-containing protein [Pseudomonadota bacterium]